MTVGLMIGLFVAFLVYLNQAELPTPDATPVSQAEKQPSGKGTEAKAGEKEQESQSKLNFDFYDMLPSFEVPVPDRKPAATEEPDGGENQPPIEEAGIYVIQAGSFRKPKDADTRKAQLALLGIVSKVQKVTVDGSKTWHRVRMGPYKDLEKLNRVRSLLKENDIEYMLLRQRG